MPRNTLAARANSRRRCSIAATLFHPNKLITVSLLGNMGVSLAVSPASSSLSTSGAGSHPPRISTLTPRFLSL